MGNGRHSVQRLVIVFQLLHMHRAPTRLEMAGWGSEPAGGEGHGGCYDNFIMVFDRYVSTDILLILHIHY